MRTKALLCLAAMAASAVTCVAQSNVYSLNIVGYVNVTVAKGFNLIADPLKPSNNNYNITNTISLADNMDGSVLFKWGGTGWAATTPGWIAGSGWDSDENVNLGEAVFLNAVAPGTITFVGEVATGDIANTINPGINFVANKVPVTEAWPGKAHGNDGDTIFTWAGAGWSGETFGYVNPDGWLSSNPANTTVDGPILNPGQGAVYQNTGPALNWTRTFNPQ